MSIFNPKKISNGSQPILPTQGEPEPSLDTPIPQKKGLFSRGGSKPTSPKDTPSPKKDNKPKIRKKVEQLIFIGSMDELEELTSKKTKATVVLGGGLVLFSLKAPSLEETENNKDTSFVKQVPRALKTALPFITKNVRTLQVSVLKQALDLLSKNSQIKTTLAIDHYLYWAKKQKNKDFVLIGGISSQNRTLISTLQYRKGELMSVKEKGLLPLNSPKFLSEFVPFIEKLKADFPDAALYIANPLPTVEGQDLQLLDDSLYQNGAQPLRSSATVSVTQQHALPLLLISLSVSGYVAGLGLTYLDYRTAAEQFDAESKAFATEFSYASDILHITEQQRDFLSKAQEDVATLTKFERLLGAVSGSNLKIKDAKVILIKEQSSNPGATDQTPDFVLNVVVAKQANTTIMEQAKPILEDLSKTGGNKIRLSRNSLSSEESGREATRALEIEGDFGDNAVSLTGAPPLEPPPSIQVQGQPPQIQGISK